MRTGLGLGERGYVHETSFYESDDELLDVVVPFLRDGVEAGEPTVVAFGEANEQLVRRAMPSVEGLQFLAASDRYARPAATIAAHRRMLAGMVADGADQIRIVGDVPHPGTGAPWHQWARYEAAANVAFDEFPLWGLCPYDVRTTPEEVLADVRRTHPLVADGAGHHHNHDYVDPLEVLVDLAPPAADPLQADPPELVLLGADPGQARRAASLAAARAGIADREIADFVTAVSEVVTNAIEHGAAPVSVRCWVGDGRIVLCVDDAGPGPTDPFVGLMPTLADPGTGGLGLWIAHQLCTDVAVMATAGGCSVRLVAGSPALH